MGVKPTEVAGLSKAELVRMLSSKLPV